jgi:hypothetical protein
MVVDEKLSMSVQTCDRICLAPKNPLKGKFGTSIGAHEIFSSEVMTKHECQSLYILPLTRLYILSWSHIFYILYLSLSQLNNLKTSRNTIFFNNNVLLCYETQQ